MRRILVVGGDDARAEGAARLCRAEGRRVARAADARQALAALGRESFDALVLLGLGSIDEDLAFFHALRRAPTHPIVPVLAVLEPAAAAYDGAFLGAGADRVLAAPYDGAAFRTLLGHLGRLAAARRQVWLVG